MVESKKYPNGSSIAPVESRKAQKYHNPHALHDKWSIHHRPPSQPESSVGRLKIKLTTGPHRLAPIWGVDRSVCLSDSCWHWGWQLRMLGANHTWRDEHHVEKLTSSLSIFRLVGARFVNRDEFFIRRIPCLPFQSCCLCCGFFKDCIFLLLKTARRSRSL